MLTLHTSCVTSSADTRPLPGGEPTMGIMFVLGPDDADGCRGSFFTSTTSSVKKAYEIQG